MIRNRVVRHTLLVTGVSLVAIEVFYYLAVALPHANDISAGYSDTISFLYIIAPSLAIAIGLSAGIFRLLNAQSFVPRFRFLSLVLNFFASLVTGIGTFIFMMLILLQITRMM